MGHIDADSKDAAIGKDGNSSSPKVLYFFSTCLKWRPGINICRADILLLKGRTESLRVPNVDRERYCGTALAIFSPLAHNIPDEQ